MGCSQEGRSQKGVESGGEESKGEQSDWSLVIRIPLILLKRIDCIR